MKYLIAPSILAADFSCLGTEVKQVLDAGADVIHFDVMDNHYVPNLSFGPVVLESLKRRFPDVPFDVHLMVKPVEGMIDAFLAGGASYISIHPESTEHPHAALSRIRNGGAKAGIVVNPGTSLDVVLPMLEEADLLLIMSVNPGFGGQKFISSSIEKVRTAKIVLQELEHEVRLEIDGGVTVENIGALAAAGADMFVAGSSIFGKEDYCQAIADMRAELASTSGA
ncbi:MAG: ribulose-phosphate 3-epimerase [Gammaproteobacteria bacterium]|nr:ribulose-phosphate 3-epimerase [Gammaproteobacteria bacterium]